MSEANGAQQDDKAARPSWLPAEPDPKNSRHRFMSSDIDLLESGNFADVKLICGDRTWKLHKSIICKRCTWFSFALSGNFEESETNTINITEYSPDLIDALIHYIYSGVIDITKVQQNENQDHSIFSACIRLWVVGDFFLLGELKEDALSGLRLYCEEKLKISMNAKPIPREHVEAIIEEVSAGIETAYTLYPHAEPCRKVLIDFVYVQRLTFFTTQRFIDLVTKVPVFGADIFRCTLQGCEDNYWLGTSRSDYQAFHVASTCDSCATACKHDKKLCFESRAGKNNMELRGVRWRCQSCVGKSGYPWQRGSNGEPAK